MNVRRFFAAVLLGALVLASSWVSAQIPGKKFGDWKVSFNVGGTVAPAIATINDGGMTLGKTCDGDKCEWDLFIDTGCEEGHSYPALANITNGGALFISLKCEWSASIGGVFMYKISPYDNFDMEMHKTRHGKISIAIPAGGDSFLIVKFSLLGGAEAMVLFNQMYKEYMNQKNKSTERIIM